MSSLCRKLRVLQRQDQRMPCRDVVAVLTVFVCMCRALRLRRLPAGTRTARGVEATATLSSGVYALTPTALLRGLVAVAGITADPSSVSALVARHVARETSTQTNAPILRL
jgi:hypothetical protein